MPARKKPQTRRAPKPGTKTAPKKRARKTAAAPKTATAAATATQKSAMAVETPPNGASTIIYVHGIGNKPPASVLKAQWDQALFEFDLGERSRLAYWVDRERYPVPVEAQASGGDFSDSAEDEPRGEVSSKATRAPWDAASELRSIEEELPELVDDDMSAAVKRKNEKRLLGIAATLLAGNRMVNDTAFKAASDRLDGAEGADVRRIQAQRYGAAAVQAKVFGFLPRPVRQWLTRKVTRTFLRDVNDLFVDKVKGERMRETVRERLRARGNKDEQFIVVAHSQGTMIAYTVLMEPEFADYQIPLFVTIGSPLGIQEVQDFLKELPHCKTLTVPQNVSKWVNVCDPLDPVALDKDLSADFKPNKADIKVENHVKFNPDSPRHPHSGTGYLALESVRQPVRVSVDTSLFQPVASFKIAKDVVRAFTDGTSTQRHRILIQLQDFATSDHTRETSLQTIYVALDAADPKSKQREVLEPEELNRYVALSLTRGQAEKLGALAHSDKKLPVGRIWKNSAKWGYVDRSIHTTQAFPAHNSYRASGAEVLWAVLDSGIHWTHPHFQTNKGTITKVFDCTDAAQRRSGATLRELDPANDKDKEAAADKFGHGAHVAGIIAGSHTVRDKEGTIRTMSGMAPDAKLVIYKVLDNNGSGEDSWIIKALDHIFETNERAGKVVIHGVNLSLGGDFDVEAFNCGHTPLCEELRRLWRQGVVVVLAAGNEGFASLTAEDGSSVQANMGMSLGDPANLEDAIVVGSVHKDHPHTYGTSFFSSRGPTADGRMKPDCVAPGERIFSVRSDVLEKVAINPNATFEQLYTEMSGTSMAAPHVSGLIASFLSKRQEFMGEPDRVKALLLNNCTDLGRQRNMQGAGMPNLVKMLVNV